MSVLAALRKAFGRDAAGAIRVHVMLKGRIGEGWFDVDQTIPLPPGATLDDLLDAAETRGIRLRAAIADSPHLAHTIMLNGERCPIDANRGRRLADGDEVYLLSPFAGG